VARLREAGPVVEKLRTAWVKVSTLGVLRLRAIKRSVQDDVFVGRNAATAYIYCSTLTLLKVRFRITFFLSPN